MSSYHLQVAFCCQLAKERSQPLIISQLKVPQLTATLLKNLHLEQDSQKLRKGGNAWERTGVNFRNTQLPSENGILRTFSIMLVCSSGLNLAWQQYDNKILTILAQIAHNHLIGSCGTREDHNKMQIFTREVLNVWEKWVQSGGCKSQLWWDFSIFPWNLLFFTQVKLETNSTANSRSSVKWYLMSICLFRTFDCIVFTCCR